MHKFIFSRKAAATLLFSSLIASSVLLSSSAEADLPPELWREGVDVPAGGRANILQSPIADYFKNVEAGRLHAQIYPVSVTGILPPYEPFKKLTEVNKGGFLKELFEAIFRKLVGIKSFGGVLTYLGLHPYPQASDEGVYQVPFPDGVRPDSPVGFGLIERGGAQGFTFSCAACHSSNLFGKTVLGMSNRFPRANDFFVHMKPALLALNMPLFKKWTKANAAEMALLRSSRESLRQVAAIQPITLGLDTSLAQVALSLNMREDDAWATPSEWAQAFPREDEFLDEHPADSKPAVWWNVKYKNRWLSDGSVVSGNPIFTNIIWNEVGRGADLRSLETWLAENPKIIDELTSAVFASEAPRFTDFFPAEKIDLDSAKRGEKLFVQSCAGCHGHYEKAWHLPEAQSLSAADKLKTTLVRPPVKTFVVDVGTDPYRHRGMRSLEKLNHLAISQANGIVIKAQKGYVPPPLVGIWARWPYFHNNSVPSLCALLTRSAKRPKVYYSGHAHDKERDFDSICNGYPSGTRVPQSWKTDEHRYDTSRAGMSNEGHDEGIFLKNGKEIFTGDEKIALIRFLQTL